MEHQPFTIAQMRPIRDCMTVSRPANLGKEVPVTWFSLGAGTTITPESYDCTTLYVGVTVLTLASYFIGHYLEAGRWEIVNSPDGMSMAFLTLSMVEIFHSFNMRSRKGSIFHMKHQNKYLWGAMALSFVLTSAVIYIPALSSAFGFERISALEYDVAIGLGLLVIPAVEISKWIRRKFA